jgi:hypothetical protein
MSAGDAQTFSLDAYRMLLADFVERGYRAVSFDVVDPTSRHLVLRHDVDISLALAASLAEAEHALGYASHYFVLVTCEQYNPATQVGRDALARIVSLGHRIGLHFDASVECVEPMEERAVSEARYLSSLAGAPVSMLSFHRPAQEWINNPVQFAGMPHTYQPKYFSEIGYCSDSRGGWWHGAPLAHDAVKAGRALQLLTHPAWWVDAHRSPVERLADHLERRREELARDLDANIVIPQGNDH